MLPAVTCVYMYLMCAGERAEPADDAVERATGCSKGSLNDTTVQLCSILGGDTGAISALRILHLYMERLGCDFQVHSLCETLATPASFSVSLLVSLCDTLATPARFSVSLLFWKCKASGACCRLPGLGEKSMVYVGPFISWRWPHAISSTSTQR